MKNISHAKTCGDCNKAIGMCNLTCVYYVKLVAFNDAACLYFMPRLRSFEAVNLGRRHTDNRIAG